MKTRIDWFRAVLIIGGGLALIYLLIKLGESPAAFFIP